MVKIFVASFHRSSDGAIDTLVKKMKNEKLWTDDYTDADYILAVGDREKIFDFTLERFRENKSIIHLWAGEISQGCQDEVYRHSITLMSMMQLCTHKKAYDRVISLCKAIDKEPNVHVIGNLFIDNLKTDEDSVPDYEYDLILYNPPTILSEKEIIQEVEEIKSKLDISYIWIEPNGDKGSEFIDGYVNMSTLPRPTFLGLLKNCRKFISNSTSIIYEAPLYLEPEQIVPVGIRNRNRECMYSNLNIRNASDNIINIFKKLC